MGLISRVLEAVAKRLPENRIAIDGDIYLRRFYLCGQMGGRLASLFRFGPAVKERLGFLPTVYLHCFYRPDHDRDLHNHPWAGTSLLLSGGYVEERWMGHPASSGAFKRFKVFVAGNVNKLDASTYHRVDTLLAERVWTLFIIGPKTQSWGFWDEARARHVNHRDYLQRL